MKDWLKWLLLGLLSIVFGLFVLGNAALATLAVTTIVGFLMLVSGGFQIVAGLSGGGAMSRAFSVILGVLLVLLGGSFLYNPLEGMISLTLLVLVLFAASGVVRLVVARRMRDTRLFWPMLISGALSILLAAYIGANFAAASVTLLGIMMGIEMLFNGAGLVALAFFVRTGRGG
ncbi:hypothetical protein D6850_15600 [Roseovarius spongiae]|uniref:HdeD family acid-resistance protein n=1 Tax=Roseovarius spongiae TaxID=2320272 RepID=A0A3A8B216_9RHOB|nr:DUF308 domain-containing protein [Roseovarius spongiae]RKF12926.1 hypothetical protein D6850_15600 [Roseovarius spongiae]